MVDTNETLTIFERYEREVARLSRARRPDARELLELLMLRESVAESVDAGLPDAVALSGIAHADRALIDASSWLAAGKRRVLFEDWRKAVGSRDKSWWWHLDEVDSDSAGVTPLSLAVAGALLATSLALMTDAAVRLLSNGVDVVGLAGTMAQGFLAMLAGGAMTKSGRQWFTRMLHRLRVPRGTRGTLVVISSLLVLLLASSGWWSLRLVSRYYNNRGALLQAEGNLSATIENYTRSLRAYPNNALVHYNLATAKEEIHDDDGAAEQYRAAIAEDSRLSAAYNNLARLQIRGGKPAVAIDLLRRGLKYKAAQRSDAYAFHKNLAWAYLALGLLQQSQRELRIASANLDGPALHCLQAQLIEKASPTIDAAQEWQKCIAKTGSDVGAVEPEWLALARERILTGGRS